MGMQVDDEVYEEFASEARERLGTIEGTLLGMEASANHGEDIKSIFRDIHTIKGNAQFIGIKNVKELSHVFEDLFGTLRNGVIELSRDLIDVSLEAVDLLGKMINNKSASIEAPSGLVQKIRDLEKGTFKAEAVNGNTLASTDSGSEQLGALRVFQVSPFNIMYLKLYKSLDHAAGETLSSLVFDYCNDGMTFIFDASYAVSLDEETETIISRMIQEVDIFNSHVMFINSTHSFTDSVCDGNEGMAASSVGDAVTKLCRLAA